MWSLRLSGNGNKTKKMEDLNNYMSEYDKYKIQRALNSLAETLSGSMKALMSAFANAGKYIEKGINKKLRLSPDLIIQMKYNLPPICEN